METRLYGPKPKWNSWYRLCKDSLKISILERNNGHFILFTSPLGTRSSEHTLFLDDPNYCNSFYFTVFYALQPLFIFNTKFPQLNYHFPRKNASCYSKLFSLRRNTWVSLLGSTEKITHYNKVIDSRSGNYQFGKPSICACSFSTLIHHAYNINFSVLKFDCFLLLLPDTQLRLLRNFWNIYGCFDKRFHTFVVHKIMINPLWHCTVLLSLFVF